MLPVGSSIALSGFYLPRVFDCGVTVEFRYDGCDPLVYSSLWENFGFLE